MFTQHHQRASHCFMFVCQNWCSWTQTDRLVCGPAGAEADRLSGAETALVLACAHADLLAFVYWPAINEPQMPQDCYWSALRRSMATPSKHVCKSFGPPRIHSCTLWSTTACLIWNGKHGMCKNLMHILFNFSAHLSSLCLFSPPPTQRVLWSEELRLHSRSATV